MVADVDISGGEEMFGIFGPVDIISFPRTFSNFIVGRQYQVI